REHLLDAIVGTSLALAFIPLFVLARFGFGFLAGFSFYAMIAGFVWISYFSEFGYDHAQARLLAYLSLASFLLPLLFVSVPVPRLFKLRRETMVRLQISLLLISLGILLCDAAYGVAFVSIDMAGEMRGSFERPAILKYATGMTMGAALPFAFAFFALQRQP